MAKERLVVIGGVAAGLSAASRARRRNPQLEIIVLEKGAHISYSACGLPYYLAGVVRDPAELIVHEPQFFKEKRNIDIRLHHEVLEIVPAQKQVRVLRGDRGDDLTLAYDHLVIATGGAPAVSIPGSEFANVFTCNDLAGTLALKSYIRDHAPRQAAIIGAGYIGLEVADAFRSLGMEVTMFERGGAVLEDPEPEISDKVEATLTAHGVRLLKRAAVKEIASDDGQHASRIVHGAESTPADLVLLATGIVPRTELARGAGLALGPTGAIAVDNRLQTSQAAIYAAGDCVETRHIVTGKPTYVPLGTTANKQGRVAGENAAGGYATFPGIVGTAVTKVFELEVARTGLSLAEARTQGFRADSVTITAGSRASYFGGKPITVKLVFDATDGRLLGAQMAGAEGVAKRIDVLATALTARMALDEMLYLDLSYAPPFAPVWDPILVAVSAAVKKLPPRRHHF